jgi:AraC family transcriptional regulator
VLAPGQLDGAIVRWAGRRLYGEFRQEDDVSTLAIEGLILELLAEGARTRRTAGTETLPVWLKKARGILEDDFLRKRSLGELAAEVGVHPVHLCREFRNRYRTTIGNFVRRRRAEHACALVAEADRSLAQVALECGFADQSHFTAVFKRFIGTTPAEFRSTLVSKRTSAVHFHV